MIRTALLFLALFSGSVPACFAEESPPLPSLGMWSWKQEAFLTAESRKEMLDFCEKENIRHIDQHISIRKGESESCTVVNEELLTVLISEASTRNITINALRGDKAMFFEENHPRILEQMKALLRFNNQLPEGSKLAGIKFDVEPYLSPEWRAGGDSRKKVILDYLTALKLLRAELNTGNSDLDLCADVPFWWDKPEFEVLFDGQQKRFVNHVQDLTDWIGIMSYRRESGLVIRFVEDEVAYAKAQKITASVAPALDTIEIKGKEKFITFWGTPPETFRSTLSEVRKEFATTPAVRMIMLHSYQSLSRYLAPQ